MNRVEALLAERSDGRKTLRQGKAPSIGRGVQVHKRPTEQAHIILGTEGLPRNHDQRHELGVLDTILGGGMSSRLFQEVREKRGLAYAVYSYRAMFADSGSFAVYAGTTPSNVETVIDIVRTELDSLVANGITEAELDRAEGAPEGLARPERRGPLEPHEQTRPSAAHHRRDRLGRRVSSASIASRWTTCAASSTASSAR